jgi:TPR repeat protein
MGDARAMSNLALVYESGKWGRPRDEYMALKLYR